MKIDATTIEVLKNFATINGSILIKEGNVLETISPARTIKAKATVTTSFPRRFGLYNLSRFISTLSLFDDPDVEFEDNYLTVSNGNHSVQLTYSDENTITKVPEKQLKLPSVDSEMDVSFSNIKAVEKALGILSVPEIVFLGKNGKIYIQAADTKNPTGDTYSVAIGETQQDFKAVFKAENMRILPRDYHVEICAGGISRFTADDVEYFIAVEHTSKF